MTVGRLLGRFVALGAVSALLLIAAGCGSDSDDSSGPTAAKSAAGAPRIVPPPAISGAGQIVYCSDMTYPPLEFIKDNQPTGADIEMGRQVAQLMGVKAQFSQTGFEGIIAAVQAKKCDAIISAMTNNAERRKVLSFIDYANVGQSLMVKQGNPLEVSKPEDLAGKSVSVLTGTLNKTLLDGVNKKLAKAGTSKIDIVTFPKDTDAVNALRTNRVDAYLSDAPVVAFYVKNNANDLEVAGEQLAVAPYGVGLRKADAPLQQAIKKAIDALYADGTMRSILEKWSLGQAALR